MERFDIRNLRINYLKNIQIFRNQNRPIVYMGETYLHTTHTVNESWHDNSNDGLLEKVSKGPRLIIVHAGGAMGFIHGAQLCWKSHSKTGDYHSEMNYNNYKKWLREHLIRNLPPNSVLVIDNAPYHNKQVEEAPTCATQKIDMQKWLLKKSISFTDDLTKPELYKLIKMAKPRYVQYEIDAMLQENGHDILRLPPYHPDLNPIELVWASLKQHVATKNVTFKMEDVQRHCDDFFNSFSQENWNKRVMHAIKIENEFRSREPAIDVVIDDIIINVGTGDSDVSDESESKLSGIEEIQYLF